MVCCVSDRLDERCSGASGAPTCGAYAGRSVRYPSASPVSGASVTRDSLRERSVRIMPVRGPRVPECETTHRSPRRPSASAFGQVTGRFPAVVTPRTRARHGSPRAVAGHGRARSTRRRPRHLWTGMLGAATTPSQVRLSAAASRGTRGRTSRSRTRTSSSEAPNKGRRTASSTTPASSSLDVRRGIRPRGAARPPLFGRRFHHISGPLRHRKITPRQNAVVATRLTLPSRRPSCRVIPWLTSLAGIE